MKYFIKNGVRLLVSLLVICHSVLLQAQPYYNKIIAGQYGVGGYSGNGGPALSALINQPRQFAIAVDPKGNAYFADVVTGNSAVVIRKVDTKGIITRFAGDSTYKGYPVPAGNGGPVLKAGMGNIVFMMIGTDGNLYIAEENSGDNSADIRKIDLQSGMISVVFSSVGTEPFQVGATASNVHYANSNNSTGRPFFIDPQGNFYLVAKTSDVAAIYKVDPAGTIGLFADFGGQTYEDGTPVDFSQNCDDFVMDKDGALYINDVNHSVIYKIGSDKKLTRYAGTFYGEDNTGDGGPATSAQIGFPYGICLDVSGNLIIDDFVDGYFREVDAGTGIISTLAGNGSVGGGDNGPALSTSVNNAIGIRSDAKGNIYFLDQSYYVLRELVNSATTFQFTPVPAKTYGDADFNLSGSASSGAVPAFSGDNASVATVTASGTVHIVGAGMVTFTATFPATGIDPVTTKTQTVTIGRKGLTVTAEDQSRGVGAANPLLTVLYDGFVNGEDASTLTVQPQATTAATTASPAGQYPITVSGGQAPNYDFTYVSGTLTVTQSVLLPQHISFGPLSGRSYGDADFDAGAVSDNSTIPIKLTSSNSQIASVVNGLIHIIGTGSVTITAAQPGDGTYAPAQSVSQTLTVNKAILTIRPDDQTIIYKDPLPPLTVSYSGFVNGQGTEVLTSDPVITTTATAGSPAGTYPIKAANASANNYIFNYVNGVLTILDKTQTITFAALPVKVYTDVAFSAGATSDNTATPLTYTSSNTSVATIDASGTIHIVGGGTTTITVSQAGDASHSAAADVSRVLTVNPASLVIAPNDVTRLQSQPNPEFTFNYAGLKAGETYTDVLLALPAATTTATAESLPGYYPIKASGAVVNSNYAISYQTGTLTVVVDSTLSGDHLHAWNSAPGVLEVEITAIASQQAAIQVYSLNGQMPLSQAVYVVRGDNHFTLPAPNLVSGMYVIRVTGQYMKQSQKVRIDQ